MVQRKGERNDRRDRQIWERYLEGWTQQRIGEEFGLNQSHVSKIIAAVRESIPEEQRRPLVATEIARLDRALAEAFAILNDTHYQVTQSGKVAHDIVEYVTDDDGNVVLDGHGNPRAREVRKLEDPTPRLQAIDRILKIGAERRKMLGLDAPTKQQITGGLKYEIVGVDPSGLV